MTDHGAIIPPQTGPILYRPQLKETYPWFPEVSSDEEEDDDEDPLVESDVELDNTGVIGRYSDAGVVWMTG